MYKRVRHITLESMIQIDQEIAEMQPDIDLRESLVEEIIIRSKALKSACDGG